MTDIAIRAEGLGKQYRLGGPRARYHTLRDQIARWFSPRGWLRAMRGEAAPLFWALKDVSFEVRRGEVVGVIGRNGAGKSTLLKILSRITEPTEGWADIHGRVGSLLEVGTGFNPELTGRENVFLNGAILGMRRAEIVRKFNAIVAFAEVERFINTPVKHYSSGMYTRLAFAVAAHLEPEILVVDEVLAVGDAEFQKKCLGKMGEVARGGRTVLFVSHNMAAVQSLCGTAVLLDGGRVVRIGPAGSVVPEYLARAGKAQREFGEPRRLGPELELTDFRFAPDVFPAGGATTVSVSLAAAEDVVVDHLCVLVYSPTGTRVAVVDLRSPAGPYRVRAGGRVTVEADLARVNLVEGEYTVGLYLAAGSWLGDVYDLTSFEVTAAPDPARVPPYDPANRGFVEFDHGPPRVVPEGTACSGR